MIYFIIGLITGLLPALGLYFFIKKYDKHPNIGNLIISKEKFVYLSTSEDITSYPDGSIVELTISREGQ